MSAENDFRAALLAHAPLVALVGQRVAMHAIAEGSPTPYVVFTASQAPEALLGGEALRTVEFTTECWADTQVAAAAVADAVEAAIAAYEAATPSLAAWVTARTGAFDADVGLDACVLSVQWIAQ